MKKTLLTLLAFAALAASSCAAKTNKKSKTNSTEDSQQSEHQGGSDSQGQSSGGDTGSQGGNSQGGGSESGGNNQGGGSESGGGSEGDQHDETGHTAFVSFLGTNFTTEAGLSDKGSVNVVGEGTSTNLQNFNAYIKSKLGEEYFSTVEAAGLFIQKTASAQGEDEKSRLTIGTGSGNGYIEFKLLKPVKKVTVSAVRYFKYVSYNNIVNTDAIASFSINGEKHNLLEEEKDFEPVSITYTATDSCYRVKLQNEDNEGDGMFVAGRIFIESMQFEF